MSRPVTVLVDASILKPRLGGIRTYALGVLGALAGSPGLELHVATSTPDDVAALPVHVIPIPEATRTFARRAVWREARLGRLASERGADVIFVPFPEMAVRPLPVPSVMMVYDVGPLVAPAYFGRAKRLRFILDQGRSCRTATRVVCPSHATVAGLHASTGTDPDKCVVIGGGPSRPVADRPVAHARPKHPYVLYVGTLLRHKNVPTLVRAFAPDRGSAFGHQLVLAGPRTAAEVTAFDALVAESKVGEVVRHVGWVDNEELGNLYKGATAVASPSLHEGYGLPVLEAMGVGVPVVASEIPAIRELAGDAVVYVSEPLRPQRWRCRLEEVCGDPGLRATLAERGHARARTHTWQGAAVAFASLFAELAR